MTITIKNFKVLDTTTGKMKHNGRKTSTQLTTITSQNKFISDLVEQQAIPGTPSTISSGPFVGSAHMASKYIKITREVGNIETDAVFIPTIMRIIKLTGTSAAATMICYAFANSPTQLPTALEWNVLFADFNQQTTGDFVDIQLPDSTLYPELYLAVILINDAWAQRTIVNPTQKICSVPSNLDYYCINPAYSNADVNESHSVNIQAYNSRIGYQNRICLAYEDWTMNLTDRDYNDVVISIVNRDFDENNINDTTIS